MIPETSWDRNSCWWLITPAQTFAVPTDLAAEWFISGDCCLFLGSHTEAQVVRTGRAPRIEFEPSLFAEVA